MENQKAMNKLETIPMTTAEMAAGFAQMQKVLRRSTQSVACGFAKAGWCYAQAKEWNAMTDVGWVFRMVPGRAESIGICMKRDGMEATFRVPRSLDYRQTHTALLAMCKSFADSIGG